MRSVLEWLTPQERAAKFPGIQRLFFNSETVQSNEPYSREVTDAPMISDEANANLVGSMTNVAGVHMPVLDIDFPARLEPSSTPGHFHLFLDIPMGWDEYQDLLAALQSAGILEPGYVGASRAKGATFVRKPGVTKPTPLAVGDHVRVTTEDSTRHGEAGVIARIGSSPLDWDFYVVFDGLGSAVPRGYNANELARV